MKSFLFAEYRDPQSGKTPTDVLAGILNTLPRGDDGIQLVRMAAFRNHLAAEGQLIGECLARMSSGEIRIWVYSRGRFHMLYSFYKARNEVCLLKLVVGALNREEECTDAKKRLKLFYSGH